MKRGMFSKFSSILQHAVDALAPQLSLQEEFVYHWKAVTGYFIDKKGEKLPVEQTNIPAHLEQMLVLLQEEEMTSERGMYGPCLEYLLQHKLLDTLYSLGRADYPPGMKQIILSFFTKLLSRIKQPILAHVNVYKAVQHLVKTCGQVQAGPTEIEEIQFLCTVCAKIKADPYLVNFFLEMPKSTTSAINPVVEEPVSGAGNKLFQEFSLVNTLITLSHSEDSRVAVKACEGLILCSSLPEPVAAHCMINSTRFCRDLSERLVDTYQKLPDSVNPADLEHVQAKWGLEVVTEREDQQTFIGKRHLVSFLSWLDYCDQLTGIANPIVAEAVARTIQQKFLVPCVQQSLLQASETGAISATAYLTRCLHTVCSERLLSEFVIFLLGEDKVPETVNSKPDTVRSRLIDRCNHVSDEVCLVTLQLFDTLLQKDDQHILDNMVLRNLATRGYYDNSHHDRNTGLPGHVREEFNNTLNQSGEHRVNKAEDIDSAIETRNCERTNNDFEQSEQTDTGAGEKSTNVSSHSEDNETEHTVSESKTEEKVISGLKDDNPVETIMSQTEPLSSVDDAHETNSIIKSESSDPEILSKASCDTDALGDILAETQTYTIECNDTENPSSSSVLPVIENEDTHDNENDDNHEIVDSHKKVDAPESDDTVELTDRLESQTSESQENVDNVKPETKHEGTDTSKLSTDSKCDFGEVPGVSPRRSRIEVHNIVNCFLSLVPEELKSSYQTSDSGYDMYLRDAHLQYSDVLKACKDWNYPDTVTRSGNTYTAEETFYEGDFLHMLLDKLSHLLDQSYPVNLQLTSVVAKLALVPHPNLHEFLLDPYLPLKPGVRTLYTVLLKVSNEIKSKLASDPNLGKKLVMVRQQLMSSSPNLNSMRKNVNISSWLEGQGELEAIIILEEFCKELSAIAFIKHHAAVTGTTKQHDTR